MKGFRTGTLAVLLAVVFGAAAFGNSKDFVVLLDTSQSMFDYHEELVDVFMTDVLKQHLRSKDTFHLISFAEKPELELVKKIERPSDVDPILKRLTLLVPLGTNTDLIQAVEYLKNYVFQQLSPNLPKTIIILSDGINNPPAESSVTPEEAQKHLTEALKTFRDKGWTVSFIRVPPLKASSETSAPGPRQNGTDQILDLNQVSNQSQVPVLDFDGDQNFSNTALGSPKVTFPGSLGPVGTRFRFPLEFENFNSQEIQLRIREVLYKGQNVLSERITVSVPGKSTIKTELPLEFKTPPTEGPGAGDFTLVFDDNNRAYPTSAPVTWTYDPKLNFSWDWIWWILGVLGGLGAIVLAIFFIRLILRTGQHLAEQGVREKKAAAYGTKPQDEAAGVSHLSKSENSPGTSAAKTTKTPVPTALEPKGTLPTTLESPGKKVPRESDKKEERKTEKPDGHTLREALGLALPSVSVNGIAAATVLPLNHGAPAPFLDRIKKNKGAQTFFLDVWTPDQIHQNTLNLANVLVMKPGDKKNLGPGHSGFRIFLKPLKKAVAEVLFDGEKLSLKPLGDHFPDIRHDELYDCTDKVIRLVLEDHRTTLLLRFNPYISKADEYKLATHGLPVAKRIPF